MKAEQWIFRLKLKTEAQAEVFSFRIPHSAFFIQFNH
jgi:hypothetical protein